MKRQPFRYEKLSIWQRSMELWQELHNLTKSFPKSEEYALTSQIRRAACSVPSNIAEGYGQGTNSAFAAFVRRSRGSVYELETLVDGARRIGYFDDEVAESVLTELDEIGKMIDAFLVRLKTVDVREHRVEYGTPIESHPISPSRSPLPTPNSQLP